jgi:hypothetical protein
MYAHTQRSWPLVLLLGLSGVVTLALPLVRPEFSQTTGPRLTLAAAGVALFVSAVVFSSLTIRVGDGQLYWHFGPGVVKKSIPLSEIARTESTTTTFLNGWGIHLTSRGWLYNVAGRRAVHVMLRDGTEFLLGSDEPESLERAISAGVR